MVAICLFVQLHQPFRLAHYRIRQIGSHEPYYDERYNRQNFHKVATRCYWPAGRLFAELLKKFPGFRVSFSIGNGWMQQCAAWDPELLELYREIFSHPQVEVLAETSAHSLSSLYDLDEFRRQIEIQRKELKEIFSVEPRVFRNTELIYSNEIGRVVAEMGFRGCLVDGIDSLVPEGKVSRLFCHPGYPSLALLPRSSALSDDIAFRFSNRNWTGWPLTAAKFHSWFTRFLGDGSEFIGLFMDFETFGEHQWADTGIFLFLEQWVFKVCQDNRFEFVTPSEAIECIQPAGVVNVQEPVGFLDGMPVGSWLSNGLQEDAVRRLWSLRARVLASGRTDVLAMWRRLTAVEHIIHMNIGEVNAGEFNRYSSPYETPYDGYLDFMNIIEDLEISVND